MCGKYIALQNLQIFSLLYDVWKLGPFIYGIIISRDLYKARACSFIYEPVLRKACIRREVTYELFASLFAPNSRSLVFKPCYISLLLLLLLLCLSLEGSILICK